ncbi:MAG: CHAD domain-containing protein [Pseudomonadota bacterium]
MFSEYALTGDAFKAAETSKRTKSGIVPTTALTMTQLSFIDSIDGRLLKAGLALIWQPSMGRAGHLSVRDAKTGERRVLLAMKSQPEQLVDIPPTLLSGVIHQALGGRALIALHQMKVRVRTADLVAKGQTIGDILYIAAGPKDEALMWVETRRGFESAAQASLKKVGQQRKKPKLFHAFLASAQEAAQLNNKGFPALKPDEPAASAIATLHRTLLAQMSSQVSGTCKDIDIEFLHDLRVASRRARSLLQTAKTVLSEDVQAYGLERYRWVGQETTTLRDLDVYLHDYPALQGALSPEMRAALEPFKELLKTERKRAFRQVKTLLTSRAFQNFTQQWTEYLTSDTSFTGRDAQTPILALANKAIAKRYQRICNDGNAITDESPAEALHDLRKQGKKLRYLLEFFASLYPQDVIKPRIASLKKLQDLLGSYQDCAVQAAFLEDKASVLRKNVSVPADTLMAMGALADQRLQDEKRLRTEFRAFFTPFAGTDERAAYKAMLKRG